MVAVAGDVGEGEVAGQDGQVGAAVRVGFQPARDVQFARKIKKRYTLT